MGKAIEGVDWSMIQLAYQRGEGSTRELGLKYGVSPIAVMRRCTREGWLKEKQEVGRRVVERVVENKVNEKVKLIEEHEKKAHRISEKLISGVENVYDTTPQELMDAQRLQGLSMSLKTSVSIARLSLGAVDPAVRLDHTSGGLSMHESSLALLASVRKLHASGQLAGTVIDIDGLAKELKESEEGTK